MYRHCTGTTPAYLVFLAGSVSLSLLRQNMLLHENLLCGYYIFLILIFLLFVFVFAKVGIYCGVMLTLQMSALPRSVDKEV